jgi:hypothetical protein
MARRGKLLTAVIPFVILLAAVPAIRYWRYAYAIAWHCQHGNYATFPGHRVKLPLSWWEEKDTVRWEQYVLKRACAGVVCIESQINVTRVVPSQEASIPASDQAEMDQRERAIAVVNGHAHPNSPVALTASALRLGTRSQSLFCEKIAMRIGKRVGSPYLNCEAARFPYTVMTSTFGPPSIEQEVESILSTLE